MTETAINDGSACGMPINEVLGTKEARRAAALAIAARELHAEPEIELAKVSIENSKACGSRTDWINNEKIRNAISRCASKMMWPTTETRRLNKTETSHPTHKDRLPSASPTMVYRGADAYQSQAILNPVDTAVDFTARSKKMDNYTDCKLQQKKSNIANAERILGTNDNEGYGYSTNRAIPHIHAKLAAHKEEDEKAWTPVEKAAFDRKWQDAQDAKAKRVYSKTQFAGNNAKGQQYYNLSEEADQIPDMYRQNMDNAKRGDKRPGRKNVDDEIDAHRERIKHYKARAEYLKEHPPKYMDVDLGNGKKGKVANIGFEASPEMKYYRELDQYKTAKEHNKPVGEKPEAPK